MMNIHSKFSKVILFALVGALAGISCNKPVHPLLGDYPKDVNPPGGPLKFFAAFEGTNVDSIRANFGVDNNVTYVAGVNGKAAQFAPSPKNGFITYGKPNDFGIQTSFSVSFWMNAGTVDKKDHVNADGIFSFAKTSDFWGNLTMFADHESSTSDSMRLTLVLAGNWQTHDNDQRIPHMYDGNWHHIAFTYDAASSTYTLYIDGQQWEQKNVPGAAFADAGPLVIGNFEQAANIQGSSADNGWQSSFPGQIDQFRMYGVALTQAQITDLYTNKK